MTEEISSTKSSIPIYESNNENSPVTATEQLVSRSITITSTSIHRTFAPLNTPLYRRRQTFTILVWLLMPWVCLYISLLLLRCNNWYIVGTFIVYLTWTIFFQKHSRQGGLKQKWLRRLKWWKWFAG
ncbi:unnamed protein product, partial [Rotaria sordida]